MNGTKILTFDFVSCSTNSIASIIYQFLYIGLQNQLSIKHNSAYSSKYYSLREILYTERNIHIYLPNYDNVLVC